VWPRPRLFLLCVCHGFFFAKVSAGFLSAPRGLMFPLHLLKANGRDGSPEEKRGNLTPLFIHGNDDSLCHVTWPEKKRTRKKKRRRGGNESFGGWRMGGWVMGAAWFQAGHLSCVCVCVCVCVFSKFRGAIEKSCSDLSVLTDGEEAAGSDPACVWENTQAKELVHSHANRAL